MLANRTGSIAMMTITTKPTMVIAIRTVERPSITAKAQTVAMRLVMAICLQSGMEDMALSLMISHRGAGFAREQPFQNLGWVEFR